MLFKFSFERFDWVTRTNVLCKLVQCTWTGDKKCMIAKLGAHATNTKVAVCRRPKIVSSSSHGCRTAKIGEVSRCHSTKWFKSQQTLFKHNTLFYRSQWSLSHIGGVSWSYSDNQPQSSLADALRTDCNPSRRHFGISVCPPVDCCGSRLLK